MTQDLDGVFAVDTLMHGLEGITAVYYLPGPDRSALIEAGPGSSVQHTMKGLEQLEVDHLDFIILTHIHLDHAGAIGHLCERFPSATVMVREEGAPHLVDPSRLWASAARLYPDMEKIWGEMRPVPKDRIRAISNDEAVADLGGGRRIDAIYTPGHARHHMALLDRQSGDLFAGDAIGVRLQDAGVIRPATPPPEFDLEAAVESIERMRAFRASRVLPTHFGPAPDVNAALDEAILRLNQWVEAAEPVVESGGDMTEVAKEFRSRREDFYPDLTSEVTARLEGTTSYDLNAAGIVRYLSKKKEAAGAS
ncbi:MAG: MBL fold metallo-hydrolase [Actinobacteria bacterium]|nr:MBL fold metallo-hydrolase [Actinomycetota bacterium]